MLQDLIADLLHDLGPWVVCLVHPMTKAHQPASRLLYLHTQQQHGKHPAEAAHVCWGAAATSAAIHQAAAGIKNNKG